MHFIAHLIHEYGLITVAAIVGLECIGLPVPGETALLAAAIYAGNRHDLNIVEVIATAAETMRRQARLETDRLHGLWEAASTAYAAVLSSAHDDQQQLAAQRAAATALSEHINASLLEPPLVE